MANTSPLQITQRSAPLSTIQTLSQQGLHPLLARLFATRGIREGVETELSLKHLPSPEQLLGAQEAAVLLADAIEAEARILIVADYDCDGATACAVGVRGLRMMGADVAYFVPNRFETGYGLTPAVVDLAMAFAPEVLVTVDNGIASVEGVAAAREAGLTTLITDHHLPGNTLPDADVIVNPNQPGCPFPSKNLAGVGVIFYVLMALRAELRERGYFVDKAEPPIADLLDLVALGTVADVVKLDRINRILVQQGVARMRAGKMQAGLRGLFAVAGREYPTASGFDLGFALGPRLNAAGRLADMGLGIECLITDDAAHGLEIAKQLDTLNRERRSIEADMQSEALTMLENLNIADAPGLALYVPEWHEGVIGIVAGRLKEKFHRPVIAFAQGKPGELKGSGRSIPGIHLRDVLDLVTKRAPDVIIRFGGHAMAAGLTIVAERFDEFCATFHAVLEETTDPALLTRTLETDGSLESGYTSLDTAKLLESQIWGQGFPAPLFVDEFQVEQQRLLKDKHLKLRLQRGTARFEAIYFNFTDGELLEVPPRVRCAYRLGVNTYNGVSSVQLMLEHLESV